MATNDGYQPYPSGLTAEQFATALKNGWTLPETLKLYANCIMSLDPPDNSVCYNPAVFWYCLRTNKMYQPLINEDENIVVWFEV